MPSRASDEDRKSINDPIPRGTRPPSGLSLPIILHQAAPARHRHRGGQEAANAGLCLARAHGVERTVKGLGGAHGEKHCQVAGHPGGIQ
jgi:hypothetical protein